MWPADQIQQTLSRVLFLRGGSLPRLLRVNVQRRWVGRDGASIVRNLKLFLQIGDPCLQLSHNFRVVRIVIPASHFTRILLKIVQFPFIQIVEVNQLVSVGPHTVMSSDHVSGPSFAIEFVIVVVQGVTETWMTVIDQFVAESDGHGRRRSA